MLNLSSINQIYGQEASEYFMYELKDLQDLDMDSLVIYPVEQLPDAPVKDIYSNIAQIFGYYMIPITAGLGLFTNIYLQLALNNIRLKRRFYHLLQAKSLAECVLCLVLINFQNFTCNSCAEQIENTYWFQFYRAYALSSVEIMHPLIYYFELLISFERVCIFYKKTTCLNTLPVRFIFALIVLLGSLALLPHYLVIKIESVAPNRYRLFLQSNRYVDALVYKQVVYRISLIFVYAMPATVLIAMTILIVVKYREFMGQCAAYDTHRNARFERNTTMVIISTNAYLILSQIYIGVAQFIQAYSRELGMKPNLIYLLNTLSFEFLVMGYSVSLFVCFLFDRNILTAFISSLICKK